jgi:allophanate hydrolase subunit 2
MGFRLEGPALEFAGGSDIVSDGIAPGSIQVPGSGQPIVLLADRQTTGGYPKIATVISADLAVFGRRRPGDQVRFEAVDLDTALQARRDQGHEIERVRKNASPAPPLKGLEIDKLYNENLISGIVTAANDPDGP